MHLPARDAQIVQLVARFKQLSSAQIQALLFGANHSRTPLDRALRRLTEANYLERIEHRMVGGARGGSGLYVYCLGRRGFYSFSDGRYDKPRRVNYHSLAIVDTFIVIRQLESDGVLEVTGFASEPDCWREVDGTLIRPDLHLTAKIRGITADIFFEVDNATESQRQLRLKLDLYCEAYLKSEFFPFVVWVVPDVERVKELKWLIGQLPPERRVDEDGNELFKVTTLEHLPQMFA